MKFDKINRRSFIKSSAVAGAGLALPTIFTSSARAYLNEPKGSTVKLGFNVPQTGPYAAEGMDELRAQQLAVEHLNGEGDGGMMNTFSSKTLKGNGILGKKVEFVSGDTQTKSDAARASARSMIEKDGVVMINGGSSSGVAVAVQGLCQEAGIIFMAGLTHSNDTTGKDRKANGFRHFFDAYMSGAALAPVLAKAYGTDRKFYMLTSDYTWGWTQADSMKTFLEEKGWDMIKDVRTPVGAGDFSSYITPVLQSGADVLILNHYGGDMINSLTQSVQFGLRDKQANGKNFEIVVPLYSELMAEGAGDNIKGVYGSMNWNWQLDNPGTKAFVKSFGEKYGAPPSNSAQTCYVQTLLYADAVERAGTFDPCGVVAALEENTGSIAGIDSPSNKGFMFDGMGTGKTMYRSADHQCFKDVLVMKGKESPTNKYDILEIVETTPVSNVWYEPDNEMFGGKDASLGKCNSGA
ncbi:MAG: ABC transporter substrate-binding protein [Salaquimonas sp.]|nr:ABC transporter substrate-binding protein [Salaquimonas sp.]